MCPWAFNSWITRTPVETLTYGTFTAALDGLTPDDNGQYRLDPGTRSLTLHTQGNVPRYVLLTVTPQGDGAPAAVMYMAAPDTETASFTVQTDYPLTLALTVLEDAPENAQPLADAQLVFAKPAEAPAPDAEETVTADPAQEGTDTTDTTNSGDPALQPDTTAPDPAATTPPAASDTPAQPSETPAQETEPPAGDTSADALPAAEPDTAPTEQE